MTKVRYVFYGIISGLLVLGLLFPLAMAQPPQEARLVIDHAPFTRVQRRGAPLAIEARITSPAGIRKAEVFCRAAGGGDFTALPMEAIEEHRYRAVVPDWMTAGPGLEYYITATDERGQTASQGFVGFPLVVRLASGEGLSQEERLKALQETLDMIRKSKEATPQKSNPSQRSDPTTDRYR
jgi:hypothetical protein